MPNSSKPSARDPWRKRSGTMHWSVPELPRLPKPLRTHMTLGLDQQGGVHLMLQVDADAVRREKMESLRDDARFARVSRRDGKAPERTR